MPKTNQWTIRGVPAEVIKETKAKAFSQGKTIGEYVSDALALHNYWAKRKKGEGR